MEQWSEFEMLSEFGKVDIFEPHKDTAKYLKKNL